MLVAPHHGRPGGASSFVVSAFRQIRPVVRTRAAKPRRRTPATSRFQSSSTAGASPRLDARVARASSPGGELRGQPLLDVAVGAPGDGRARGQAVEAVGRAGVDVEVDAARRPGGGARRSRCPRRRSRRSPRRRSASAAARRGRSPAPGRRRPGRRAPPLAVAEVGGPAVGVGARRPDRVRPLARRRDLAVVEHRVDQQLVRRPAPRRGPGPAGRARPPGCRRRSGRRCRCGRGRRRARRRARAPSASPA